MLELPETGLSPCDITIESQLSVIPDPQNFVDPDAETHRSKSSWIWHVLHFMPFVVLVWFVSRFSVNVPLIDEWRFAYLFHAVRFKQATFNDFWGLNYEHRIFFPKLIWTVLAFATHWNLKVEMMVNLVPVLITFVVLNWLALQQAKQTGNTLLNLAIFSTSLLLFSLMQYETWLWGIGGGFLLVQASVALAIGVCFIEELNAWFRFVLAAFFCVIASFSSAHGMFSWIALLPCVALLPGPRKAFKVCLWGLMFAASIALYTYRYQFFVVPEASGELDFLHHPLRSAGFFCTLVGGPLSASDSPLFVPFAYLAGVIILLALVGCALMLRSDEHKNMAVPWFSVALFGLLFTALVTAGRSPKGLVAANQSRYVTGTVFVLIAVIHLGRLVCQHRGRQVYTFLLGAVWALVIFGSISSVFAARDLKEQRSHAKLFLELLRYMDPVADGAAEGRIFPIHPAQGIRPSAELLNDIGFIHLASNVAFVEQPSSDCGSFEYADGSGSLMHLRQHKDEITVSGWASLPKGRGLPKVVLISYGDQKTFITGAVVGIMARPEIATIRRDAHYLYSGWRVSFPAEFLPTGEGVLKAWVYDAAEKKFVRMPESGAEKRFRVEAP